MTTPLAELDGCTDPDTYDVLYELACDVPADQAIVELGTYRAKGTCYLAAGARDGAGAHVWTFDPHDLPGHRYPTSAHPSRRLDYSDPAIRRHAEQQVHDSGLGGRITMTRDFSAHAASEWTGPPIGLLFVDGDHRQSAVRKDFRLWQSHLARGATIVFDDFDMSHPGVPRAVVGLVNKGHLRIVDTGRRIAVCRETGGRGRR